MAPRKIPIQPNQVERTADYKWRMARLERHVIGTEEENWQDGLIVWRANLDKRFAQIMRIIHLWGGGLLAAFLASGVIDQRAAHVIGAFFQGLNGQ
jgi:hypothetical protein